MLLIGSDGFGVGPLFGDIGAIETLNLTCIIKKVADVSFTINIQLKLTS